MWDTNRDTYTNLYESLSRWTEIRNSTCEYQVLVVLAATKKSRDTNSCNTFLKLCVLDQMKHEFSYTNCASVNSGAGEIERDEGLGGLFDLRCGAVPVAQRVSGVKWDESFVSHRSWAAGSLTPP